MIESFAPVTVGWYLHPIEAEIARGLLESEGIPAFLHTNNHSLLDWPLTLALGGIRLQVPPGAAQEAIEILQTVDPLPDIQEEIACPDCGSLNTKDEETSWQIAFLIVHFLHIPLPFRRGYRRCLGCDKKWR
jgi:hypothetical protein